ncbi:MAG TPA: PLP-dependent aminotransferase family protein [Deinococcales bacterium]|nr:PLP-dependent aminotransferase family protein [Deinococcales bacterium]
MDQPNYPLAARMLSAKGSTIREMLKTAGRKDMISFAGGLPAPDLFDLEGIRAATDEALTRDPVGALQYSATEGHAGLRAQVAGNVMASRGVRCEPDDLLITSGAQQGIDLIGKVMLDPGDLVVLERPSYLAAIQIFGMYQARFRTVDVDADGLDVDELERVIREEKPKLIYLVATFANPSGATLSLERRRRVLQLAAEHGVLVVEDDPYSELRFSGEAIPPLVALADDVPGSREWCVYLSSLSKIVSPGLRVAWMLLPPGLRPSCVIAKQGSDLHTSSFAQHVAYRYLSSNRLPERLPIIRDAYGARGEAMMAALAECMPPGTVQFASPAGGMFLWARLAEGVDTVKVVQRAMQEGVIFVPGVSFYAEKPQGNYMRLSFATPTPSEIQEGVRRLARVIVD